MTIHFRSIKEKLKIINPFKGFALDEIPFEIRFDPLTGQTTRIFDLPYRPVKKPDLNNIIEKSLEEQCPFCPESIDGSTPLYPDEISPEGRIRVGEACIVPNLLPLDRHTGVCIICRDHFIPIGDFTSGSLTDAFRASVVYIKRVAEADQDTDYFNINWNYMPPSGSSMVHPHLQVNCGAVPTQQLRIQLESSFKYYLENRTTFWGDYMVAEREAGKRFLTDIGPTFWTMSFTPHGALPDIWCIFHGKSTMLELDHDDLDSFIKGLVNGIRYFDKEGLYSFNLSMFSGRENEHFRINARITPRLLLREIGNSDQSYYQVLHKEPCSIKSPESVRQKVLEVFKG